MGRIFTIIFTLFCLTSFAQEPPMRCAYADPNGRSREHNVDMQHMLLDVAFEPAQQIVNGTVQYQFKPIQKKVDTLFLDAPSIRIDEVKFNGNVVPFDTNSEGLIIRFKESLNWGSEHQITIKYQAEPKKGIYFIGWLDSTNTINKQIWTQGQGIDNRHWIPSYDHQNDKLITETRIQFDSTYDVISNGLLSSKTTKGSDYVWHYKMSKPHASYLVMIGIGKYDHKDVTAKNGIISRQYYYKGEHQVFEHTYQHSAAMMDWMEEEFGVPYPWEIYRNVPVHDFIYGAMENTTATILTDFYVRDERSVLDRDYINVNAHELTHQWFGDLITAWGQTHHWLHESFATHYAKHFKRTVTSEDDYQWERKREMDRSLRASKRNVLPVAHSQAGSARHYPKGSLVLDMLRYVVGEEQYKSTIKYYLEKHQYGNVNTDDFWQAFMENLGVNIDWFLDQWILRGGEPDYVVDVKHDEGHSKLFIEQRQNVNKGGVGYFKMPIDIAVHYTDGTSIQNQYWIESEKDTVNVQHKAHKVPAFVVFDVNNQILKKAKVNQTDEAFMAQLSGAKHMINRYEAVRALKSMKVKDKIEAFIAQFKQETHYGIKSEIIAQLGKDEAAAEFLIQALQDADARVRGQAISSGNWDKASTNYKKAVEACLKDKSYQNIESALRKLCEHDETNAAKYLAAVAGVEGKFANVKTERLKWQAKLANDTSAVYKSAIAALTDLSSQKYEFVTRSRAIRVLSEFDKVSDQTYAEWVDAGLYFNRRLSGTAKRAIGKHVDKGLTQQNKIKAVMDRLNLSEADLDEFKSALEPTPTEKKKKKKKKKRS